MDRPAQIARSIADLAAPVHAEDPAWPDYVAAYSTPAALAHFPAIVALAKAGRRDWYATERLHIVGPDFLTVTTAAMLALHRAADTNDQDRATAAAVLDLLRWHQEREAAQAPVLQKDDGTIPF